MYSPFSFLFPPLYICKTKKVRHDYINLIQSQQIGYMKQTYVHSLNKKSERV
ncbi:hypothetical protein BMWSH_2089 [Priestia megaterium WSH-002]|uniref:Uncharacterized protein n=1 Tax=Priestia megaterium (strain WSH-002) TaxID=1006007 RepID=A0A8D4BJU4_PRIMW|nr:hypothetical protein BMWSH_2089 [Priestia megaterium WSH-002]